MNETFVPNISESICEYHITEGVPVEWFWTVVIIFFIYIIGNAILDDRIKNKKVSDVQQDNG